MHGLGHRPWIHATIIYIYIYIYITGGMVVQVTSTWWLKRMFKAPTSSFYADICRRQTAETLVSSATSDEGSLSWFTCKSPSIAAARCGPADLDSYMDHVWWFSTTFSSCSLRILEQPITETVQRMGWPSSMACPFPYFNSLQPSGYYIYLQV